MTHKSKYNMDKKDIASSIEVKLAADTKTGTFSGYGSVFGNVDDHGDIIIAGAFAKSLAQHKAAGSNPLMLLNHDFRSMPIGFYNTVEEDAFGLKVAGSFLETTTGKDAYMAAKAGAISGLSIGYQVVDSEIKGPNRIIKEVKLLEISLVTFPSNSEARVVDVKSADLEAIAALTVKVDALASEIKSLCEKTSTDAKNSERKSDDECEDDSDCEDGCTCNDDGECEDDEETKSETKYSKQAIEAMRNLSAKLKQEKYGR